MNVANTTPIRILREPDLRAVLNVSDALSIIEKTFADYGSSYTQCLSRPPSLFAGSGEKGDGAVKVKAATLTTQKVTGVRLISDRRIGEKVKSHHILCIFDDTTALPIGLIDETWLHRFRTALTGVVAAKILAKSNSSQVALIGAGAIASQLFPALTDSFNLSEIRVVAKHSKNARIFCEKHQRLSRAKLSPVLNAADAVHGADIVITLTFAQEPVIFPGMLKPGSFLCSMGETEEVDLTVLDEIDCFVVDDFNYATVLGDIAQWIKRGKISRENLESKVDANIGEIIANRKPGRKTQNDKIMSIIQGMAICDLALAHFALKQASIMNLGEEISLFEWQ
ncbi:MAG: hypothetical protein CMM44_10825 [Rhodospirillaceae bacterium]|nr:hypothetical protein [Rhodospirillaceae bacterium]|tara:strand:- start:6032 stop:7048 length:1017 start_codon:yes stop_codon:yes gene_type:complete